MKVTSGEEFNSRLISSTVFNLLNFEKHANFQAAAEAAAVNNDFQLVILDSQYNPVFTVETRHDASVDEVIRLAKEMQPKQRSRMYTKLEEARIAAYFGPVNIAGGKHFMILVDNRDAYSPEEITRLADIIEVAMTMWKYTPENDAKAEFINALIRGNKSLAYSLKDEAGIVNEEILCVFMGKNIQQGDPLKTMIDFEAEKELRIVKRFEGNQTYGIVIDEDAQERGEDENMSVQCEELFRRMESEEDVEIFHVTNVDGIEGAGDACRLIAESWAFVRMVFPQMKIFSKYEMAFVSNLINVQLQEGHVMRNYMKLLEPLEAKPGNKSRQLLKTLEVFVLDANMNSTKTAEIMQLHINTVLYRLKKAGAVLGIEISSGKMMPGLVEALALRRIERAVS